MYSELNPLVCLYVEQVLSHHKRMIVLNFSPAILLIAGQQHTGSRCTFIRDQRVRTDVPDATCRFMGPAWEYTCYARCLS